MAVNHVESGKLCYILLPVFPVVIEHEDQLEEETNEHKRPKTFLLQIFAFSHIVSDDVELFCRSQVDIRLKI